ncbi:MAG: dihydroorotase, partial [Acidobacteria bacterium]|nr:dihydroorotase [Acidobacteriota bacterium]
AQAAAAGGFTSICVMPNTKPVNDNAAVTRFIVERAREKAVVNVFPVGAVTNQSQGETLAEIGEMVEAGAVAISDDGRSVMNADVLRRAMEYAHQLGIAIIDHCQDMHLSGNGVMHEGYYSTTLGLRGIPAAAEEVQVARDVILAGTTGAHVHIAHLSTAGSLELVRQAKRKGMPVTCEVTPHHFALTDEAVTGYDTNTKMYPPLRTQRDVESLIEGIADGTVDAIATDHAPHHLDEKMFDYDQAPFGIIGLETALSLALDRLLHSGKITLTRLVELLSTNPARIVNLQRGTLRTGAVADVTIFDPQRSITVDVSRFTSKSRNSPFNGWTLRGAVRATMVAGKIMFQSSESA